MKPEVLNRATTVTDVVIISYSKCMCRTCSVLLNLKFLSCFLSLTSFFFFPFSSHVVCFTSNKCVIHIVKWKGAKRKGLADQDSLEYKMQKYLYVCQWLQKKGLEIPMNCLLYHANPRNQSVPCSFNSTAFRLLLCDFHSKGSILM